MPQLERCSREGRQHFFHWGQKNAAFFFNTSMLGSFILEIRKLVATFEAEFNSPIVAGMGSNPLRADFC